MNLGDRNVRFSVSTAKMLVLDSNAPTLDLTRQMLKGLGVASITTCATIAEVEKTVAATNIELFIIESTTEDSQAFDLVNRLRRIDGDQRMAPILLTCAHVRLSDLARARDCGANFILAKPLSPEVLSKRISWLARDNREFIETETYIGPDRRFKFEGPPLGMEGRRSSDVTAPLSVLADEPNMSQSDIDAMFQPRRMQL